MKSFKNIHFSNSSQHRYSPLHSMVGKIGISLDALELWV